MEDPETSQSESGINNFLGRGLPERTDNTPLVPAMSLERGNNTVPLASEPSSVSPEESLSELEDTNECPIVFDATTPNVTDISVELVQEVRLNSISNGLNPDAESFVPSGESIVSILGDIDVIETSSDSDSDVSEKDENIDNPYEILSNLKEKNSERPVIAHLNINSISSKFEPLVDMVKESVDFLLVTESKLDDTFPLGQFQIEGFSRPIRLDRTRNGGGIIIFARDDLICNELKPRIIS